MICKFCGTEMEKTFSFDRGKGYSFMECPNCGQHTSKKEISYSDNGNVILATDKNGVPCLMYDNEGNLVDKRKRSKKTGTNKNKGTK